ncbi:MAG TPA: hypothetical protein VHK01_21130 [Lacipirellulaceae bacterium]|jgi:hypothetical protein|nr:hypothetical protein [Lacipirellulaceae bacterium]
MTNPRIQFSLRSLLIATTVLAVLTAMVANHFKVLIGSAVAAMWILELASWFHPFVAAFKELEGPKASGQVKRERMSKASEKYGGRSV